MSVWEHWLHIKCIDFNWAFYLGVVEKAGNNVVVIKTSIMSRLKQNQSIDSLIQSIIVITKNQCSLSEQDKIVLDEAFVRLQKLKQKKGRTNQQILIEIAKVIDLLTKFFVWKQNRSQKTPNCNPNTP